MGDSLYSISNDLKTVIEGGVVFDEDTGEILFDPSNMDALQVSMADKVEAVAAYSAGRRALAKARKEIAAQMTYSARMMEREADRLDEYAIRCVKEVGGTVETDAITVSVRKCPASVEVLDEASIPDDYFRQTVKMSVDKAGIKKALQSGDDVPGACLVQNERLSIR